MKLHKKKESGSSIILVALIISTLLVVVAISMDYTMTIQRLVQRSNTLENAVAIGDGATESMYSYWREISRENTNFPVPSTSFQTIPLPTQTQFSGVPNFTATAGAYDSHFTVSNCKVVAVDPQLNPIDLAAPPPPATGQTSNSVTYNYLASADVTLPTLNGSVVAKVRRVFQKEQLSPWNWAIFYVDPLEIQPGQSMDVTGWVHTNADLYTGHNLLHFLDKVTYASDWVLGFKPGDPRAIGGTGVEIPTPPNWLSNLPPALDIAHQPFGLDSTRIMNTADANPNNDSYHELLEQATAGYSDPLAGSRYYDQAGIKILIDATSTLTIKKYNGTTVTSASTGNDLKLYNAVNGAITKNQPIQDNREAASVRLTTLDVGLLLTSLKNPSSNSSYIDSTLWNGIIYMTDTSATSGTRRGIRLKNGKVLPSRLQSAQITVDGLTVASGNPIYIQGDYNTGTGSPPSNSGDPTTPQSAPYIRQPCSVVGDAVNILSNAWADANSAAGLASRIASSTTVNAAIVSGIVPSANEVYSGGAENLPRFLEDWGGKTFTYYGSLVELYQSKQSIGVWGKANVYGVPNRRWYFDPTFRTRTPPGTLMVYSYIKGRWSLAQ